MTNIERTILENQLLLLDAAKSNAEATPFAGDLAGITTAIEKTRDIISSATEETSTSAPQQDASQNTTDIAYMEWLYDSFGLTHFSRDPIYPEGYDDEPQLIAFTKCPSLWDGSYSQLDDGVSSTLILDSDKIPMIKPGQCYNIIDKEFVSLQDKQPSRY